MGDAADFAYECAERAAQWREEFRKILISPCRCGVVAWRVNDDGQAECDNCGALVEP